MPTGVCGCGWWIFQDLLNLKVSAVRVSEDGDGVRVPPNGVLLGISLFPGVKYDQLKVIGNGMWFRRTYSIYFLIKPLQ